MNMLHLAFILLSAELRKTCFFLTNRNIINVTLLSRLSSSRNHSQFQFQTSPVIVLDSDITSLSLRFRRQQCQSQFQTSPVVSLSFSSHHSQFKALPVLVLVSDVNNVSLSFRRHQWLVLVSVVTILSFSFSRHQSQSQFQMTPVLV